ncbi:hypothetical protein [Actinomadura sp. LOL_011]|uniref:hypothetical protein n=1 Tax=Actinomadura sp. LOL_011 TaxID=3345410 RepID=UPI003A7FDFAE
MIPNRTTTLRDQLLNDVAPEQMPAVRAAARRFADRINVAIAAAAESVHRTRGVPLETALDHATDICLRHLATHEPDEFERYARAMTILHDDLSALPPCAE